MAPPMQIRQSQVALFCRVNLADKLTLATSLRDQDRERFDGEPVLVPAMPDSPPEVPGIILQSSSGTSSLVVSSARIDITTRYEQGQFDSIYAMVDAEKQFLSNLAGTLASSLQIEGNVKRVGVIIQMSATLGEEMFGKLRQRFVSAEVDLGQYRTEIGLLDRQSWNSFEVNRWVRLMMSKEPSGPELLEVVLDFNTIPELEYDLDAELLTNFLEQLGPRATNEMRVFDV